LPYDKVIYDLGVFYNYYVKYHQCKNESIDFSASRKTAESYRS